MKAGRLAIAGSFCWKKDCPDYGKVDHGNIVRYGRTSKGTQRLKCKTFGRVFVGSQNDSGAPRCLHRGAPLPFD